LKQALKTLTQSVDSATGVPRRFESLDALKARVPLEQVVAQCLEQEPENPGSNELRFLCIWHNDNHPSLWVNVEKQRWGCNAGCYSSGDVIDFIQKVHRLTYKEALEWLRIWDHNHNRSR
jgi:DNA primase